MKKIFKLLFLSLFVITVSSCDNEDQELLTLSPGGSGEITAPETGSIYILNPEENQLNTILTVTWNAAVYSIPTKISYKVEFAKTGTDFAEPFLAGATTNTYLSWNIQEFNGAAVTAGLDPFIEGNLDIRIISTVGDVESTPQTSATITVAVTPFTTDLPLMAVPGQYQGWSLETAPLVAASAYGATDYEGYIWLTKDPSNDEGFLFIEPDDNGEFIDNWDIKWGDDSSYSGILKESGDNCKIGETDTDGFYYVKADTGKLTYTATKVNWGIIGDATPTGWDSDTDMVYDATTKTLSVDIDLVPGPFKFRGNDEWNNGFDLGTVDDDGYLQGGGDLTFDGAAGNYHVVLDLSNPREYTYSVTAN